MSDSNPISSNLDSATIQVADMISEAAYDDLDDFSSDSNITQLESQGWSIVPALGTQTNAHNRGHISGVRSSIVSSLIV